MEIARLYVLFSVNLLCAKISASFGVASFDSSFFESSVSRKRSLPPDYLPEQVVLSPLHPFRVAPWEYEYITTAASTTVFLHIQHDNNKTRLNNNTGDLCFAGEFIASSYLAV